MQSAEEPELKSNSLPPKHQRQESRIEKPGAKSATHSINSNVMVTPLFDNLENEQLLTAEQLAIRLNIAVKTVRKWRYERVLPPESMVKLHHGVRYRWEKVLEWLITKG